MKLQQLGLIPRIALLVVLVEVTAFGALGWYYVNVFSNDIDQRYHSRMQLVGQMIALQELQISAISQKSVISALVGAPYLDGMVIGGNDRIIVSTRSVDLGRLASKTPGIDPHWLSGTTEESTFFHTANRLTAVIKMADAASSNYTTIMTISTDELDALKSSVALRGQLGSLLFILLSTIGIVFITQRLITRRVNTSLSVLKQVENGNLTALIPISTSDELGRLQQGINSMTETVGQLLSQHRHNEAELRNQKDLLNSIIQHAPMRVFWKDRDSRFVGCNSLFLQDTGLSKPEDLIGKTDYDLSWNAQAALYRADDKAVIESGIAKLDFEEPSTAPDGSRIWLSTSKVPLRDEHNQITGILGIYTDITGRKLAEQQQRIASVAFETYEAITITDAHTNIIRANTAFEKISGYREQELTGQSPCLFISDIHENNFFSAIRQTLTSVGSWQGMLWIKDKSGTNHPTDTTISAVRDTNDKTTHYVFISTDITLRLAHEKERKLREEELYQHRENLEKLVETRTAELTSALTAAENANRAKSDFLSSMSHELRTPMNAILGFGQLLFYDDSLKSNQKDNINEILKAGEHLLQLINEVLDLARIESGKIDLSLEPVELAIVAQECLSLINPLAEKRNISMTHGELQGAVVQADLTRLKQVLLNLLSNAIKYNREGGAVTLNVEARGSDHLRILVTDTGQGIPADHLSELFKPFSRLSAANSNIEGTGIGLTITRRIVEMMGGSVDVNSEVGVGSTFWIELPAASQSELIALQHNQKHYSHPAPHHTTTQHTILYIEDNPSNLKLVTQILGQRKHIHLLTAHTPHLGIELARTRHPDLILLDINMPDMNGYEVLKIFKADPGLASIPVVAVSANAMTRDIERGQSTGFTDYLTKPLNIEKFNDVLDHLLNNNRLND